MNKRITLIWFSAIPLWLLISFARKNPELVEKYYSRVLYPLIFELHKFFLDLIPFSFGDALLILLTFMLFKTIKKKIYYWRIRPQNFLINLGSILILIVWIFHISWGFNYHRLPLNEQIGIPISYTEEDIENRLDKMIEESNQLHNRIISSDTSAIKFPFSKEQLTQKISVYNPINRETLKGFQNKKFYNKSTSVLHWVLWIRNPFTLESQVNLRIPIQSLITTSMHETAHQLG